MTVLGIDIGGTGIKGAPVCTEKGELLAERFRVPTPHPALPNAVADVVAEIARHFNYSGPAGITFPGVIKNGIVYSAANVDASWISTDAAKLFANHLQGKTVVVNDADAAGVAEMTFGAGRGRRGVVIMLTFGTGIGSAIFYDGRLLPNSEFGHLQLRGEDAEKRASEKAREDKGLSWKKWAAVVSEYLTDLETLFSPELFIIGGGASSKAGKFLPYLTAKTEVLIAPAEMRNEAGIIGAAWLAANN